MAKVQMIDYIREQKEVLQQIFDNKDKVAKPFVEMFEEHPIKKIYTIGTGSSYHAALVGKDMLAGLLDVEVDCLIPTTFERYEKININGVYKPDEILAFAISQGGKSSSTINAIEKAKSAGIENMTLTSDLNSPITEHTSKAMHLMCGEEKVPPETKGYTATLITLMLGAIESAYSLKRISKERHESLLQGLQKVISNYDDHVQNSIDWYQKFRNELMKADDMMIIGYGVNIATIEEGTLKVHETVRKPAMGYEMEEFLHGPYMAVNKNSFIFFIGAEGAEKERMKKVNDILRDKTDHRFILINKDDPYGCENDIRSSFADIEEFTPLEYVVPFQVIAYYLATDLGIDTTISAYPGFGQQIGSKVA